MEIVNPWDSLCLPRAIVVTRLHAQKPDVADPEWEKKWLRMRLGDTQALEQKRQAVTLMEEAGCDTTQPCGPEEWSKLQRVLAPEFRLKIFQFKVNTRIMFKNMAKPAVSKIHFCETCCYYFWLIFDICDFL